jgi:hypothetical protein
MQLKERERERELSTEENRLEKKITNRMATCTWPYIKIAKHPLSWWMLIFQESHACIANNDHQKQNDVQRKCPK